MRKSNGFRWKALSQRQKQVLSWWTPQSAYSGHNGIIADGAIRSGKTFAMSFSFVQWAMTCYSGQQFAMCGKTIASFRRNVLGTLKQQLAARGYNVKEHRAENCMTVSKGSKVNEFYFFGGKDESSQDLIQGITLAGTFFDEVALMPQSFVNQATARCSVTGSKFWFNCNPGSPQHWFYLEWVRKCRSRKMMYLHFTMNDNLSLSEDIKARYRSQYSGVFYERYILGRWVMAEGLIYDMMDTTANTYRPQDAPVGFKSLSTRTITCDYGTTNPTVYLDVYDDGEKVRVHREYRWDSRQEHRQKTDEEYADDFMEFMGKDPCAAIVDPAAASFITALRQRGVYVIEGNNDVLNGIRKCSTLLSHRDLLISTDCEGLLDELGTYRWDDKAALMGVEKPIKQQDHGPDALRYYINSLPDWRFERVQT